MRKKTPLFLSLISGIIFGTAFVNSELSWLSLICLVPLLLGISQAQNLREAAVCGALAGFTAAMITTWPLTSADAWTGWQIVATDQIDASNTQRAHFLKVISLFCGICCGIFWMIFAVLAKGLGKNLNPWALLFLLPILWVVIAEWLMTLASLKYQWIPLGVMLGHFPWLEQSAAFGGVWILSTFSVLINTAIFIFVEFYKAPGIWKVPLAVGMLVFVIGVSGAIRKRNLDNITGKYGVAVVQFVKPGEYTISDYTDFFMERNYLHFTKQAFQRFPERFELMVLPETVGFGAISLNRSIPSEKSFSTIDQWSNTIKKVVNDNSILILGMSTLDQDNTYNSMLVWRKEGLVGRYDKRRLVPFSEYQPISGGVFQGKSKFSFLPGRDAQILTVGKWKFGFIICQEVLFPDLLRDCVNSGANILISSGNDGVFSNPVVARINANAARLRAIETGRYMVRAMKSGISAIIHPNGRIVTQAEIGDNKVIVNLVDTLEGTTPYMRWGDWTIGLLCLSMAGFVICRVIGHPKDYE